MPPKSKSPKAKTPADKNGKTKKEIFQKPKGTHDILPSDWPWWDRVIGVAKKYSELYGFGKIETPIIEHSQLFVRGVGDDTDVVAKEMYTFKTKGGDTFALRPEATASIVRAYMEHSLARVNPVQKLWYEGPMFRHERPQSGRYREFHQIGLEVLGGVSDPIYDAHVILIFWRMLQELKLKRTVLKINSIGCRVCRPNYIKLLQAYYKNHLKKLCKDCERRYTTNPLRMLDCKEEGCMALREDAPNFFDKLCAACSKHFRGVLEYLEESKVPYTLDNYLVRGLDYYSRTVFEMFVEDAVAGSVENNDLATEVSPDHEGKKESLPIPKKITSPALIAGGRYDYLFELLGSRPNPAVGGAIGIERLIATLKAQEVALPQKREKKVFLIHVGDASKKKLFLIMEDLRDAGIQVREAFSKDSLKAQLKSADREHAGLAIIVGQQELFEDAVIIRDLTKGTQETIPHARMLEEVKKRLK